jgi:hypothetical protein
MNSKIISAFAFAVILLSFASAMDVYSGFDAGDNQVKTVYVGDSVTFSSDFFSMNPPISSMKVKLYSGESITHSFLDSQTSGKTYSETYTFTASKAGTYQIISTGTDSVQTDSNILTLIVLPKTTPDTTKPVITIIGSNPASVYLNHAYNDAGATALDNKDGDLTSNIYTSNLVNVYALGTYTVTYSVSDEAGNTATATRTVKVIVEPIQDTTKPVITIIGSNPATIYAKEGYSDAGATAYDNIDGDLTSNIQISNNINTNIVGTYYVTYTVSDKAGNTATATRTVKVIAKPCPDTTKPVITVLGSNPATIYVGDSYTDAGATAYDNVDGDITSRIQKLSNVNRNVAGTYSVTYSVSDNAGNSASATRTVKVITKPCQNHAPIITSSPSTQVNEGELYSYHVIATDDEGDIITYSLTQHPSWISVSSSGVILGTAPTVNADTSYSVTVKVSDGKASNTQTFTVIVKNTEEPLPSINVISPIQGKVYKTDRITFKVETDGDGVSYSIDNGKKVSMDGDYNNLFTDSVSLSNGKHKVTFYAINEHGQTSKTIEFTVRAEDNDNEDCPDSGTVNDSPTQNNNNYYNNGATGEVISGNTTSNKLSIPWYYIVAIIVLLAFIIAIAIVIGRLRN